MERLPSFPPSRALPPLSIPRAPQSLARSSFRLPKAPFLPLSRALPPSLESLSSPAPTPSIPLFLPFKTPATQREQ